MPILAFHYRDLTANDLPLLENLRTKSLSAIREKYGVRPDQIRAYFHYQPCFYHLHVHFVSLKYDAPASSTLAAVLLDDVINNLKIVPDFYKKATLTFARKRSDKLLQMFREAGRFEIEYLWMDLKAVIEMCSLLVLYGSETGTAEDVAEGIWKEARLLDVPARLFGMDQYDIENLPNEKVVVFVVATTGQGEIPPNMRSTWLRMLRKSLPRDWLQNVSLESFLRSKLELY
ncbi:flavodoxin [Cooperia oncophora]